MISRRSVLAGAVATSAFPFLTRLAAASTPGNTLVIAKQIDDVTSGFDPAEVFDITNAEVNGNVYRTLVTADPHDATKSIPDLAEGWKISPDGKVYTFSLKPGLQFESGNPVTAADVVFSLQRLVKLNKAPAYYLTQFGWTSKNVDAMAVAISPSVVMLTFPVVQAPGMIFGSLADTCAGIVDKLVVLSKQTNGDLGNGWLRTHSAGSGAYSLSEWRASERIVLIANSKSALKASVQRVVIRHVSDAPTQSLLVQKGDVDIARNLGSDQLKALSSSKAVTISRKSAFVQMYLNLNSNAAEFKNPAVRQAIKYAIDYDTIEKNITPNAWYVSQSFLPKGMAGCLTETVFKQDISQAKALLSSAGFNAGLSISMDHYASWPYADIAQAIQADLSKVGIKLQLQAGEMNQVASRVRARQHQMALTIVASSVMDPSENAALFCANSDDSDSSTSRSFAWRAHFSDPSLTKAVEEAGKELNQRNRLKMYEQIQRDWFSKSPFVMLLQQLDSAVMKNGVSNFEVAPIPNFTTYSSVKKA